MKTTLRQWQVFAAVARHGQVTRAADEVALSQSAASTALAELEQQLGRPLFDRRGRRLHLNREGTRLLPLAVTLLEQAEALESLGDPSHAAVQLTLGASPTVGNHLLPAPLAKLVRERPGSRIRMLRGPTRQMLDALRALQVDIAFIEGECNQQGLTVIPWEQDELTLICAVDHPLAGQALTTEQLLQQPWVLREPGSGTRALLQTALGTEPDNIVLELGPARAIITAVAAGAGLGCLSRRDVTDALESGELAEVQAPALNLRRCFSAVLLKNRQMSPALKTLLAALGLDAWRMGRDKRAK